MKRALFIVALFAVLLIILMNVFVFSEPDDTKNIHVEAFKDQGDLAFVQQGLLHLWNSETGEIKQLTTLGKVLRPSWSYDGQWLAYIHVTVQESERGTLWLSHRSSSQIWQIQGLPQPVGRDSFCWSPTANTLAVAMSDGIWLINPGGEPRHFLQTQGTSHLAWSPDGKSLAYNHTLPITEEGQEADDALYTIILEEEGQQPIERLVAPGSGIQVAAWWPDGNGLLYRLNPLHAASLAADGMGLWSLRLEDNNSSYLVDGLAYKDWLSLSPTGNLIMVAGNGRDAWSKKNLALINPASGTVKILENPSGTVALDPALSPDGKRVAFVAARDLGNETPGVVNTTEEWDAWINTRTLWSSNADGTNPYPLTAAGTGIYQPLWSKDGSRILYLRDDALWIIAAEDTAAKQPAKVLDLLLAGEDLLGFYGHFSLRDFIAWYQH